MHESLIYVSKALLLIALLAILAAVCSSIALAAPILIREGRAPNADIVPAGQWRVIHSQADDTVQACVSLATAGPLNCWMLDKSTASVCVKADGVLSCSPLIEAAP